MPATSWLWPTILPVVNRVSKGRQSLVLEYPIGSDSPDRSDQPLYTHQPSFTYIDFAHRSDGTRTFKYHEFSWDTVAIPIFEEHINELSDVLDKKIRETQTMTYGL